MRVTILVKAVGVDCVEFSGTYIRSAVDGLCRAVPFCGVFLFLWSRLFLVSACLEQCHTGTAFLSCLVLSCLVLSCLLPTPFVLCYLVFLPRSALPYSHPLKTIPFRLLSTRLFSLPRSHSHLLSRPRVITLPHRNSSALSRSPIFTVSQLMLSTFFPRLHLPTFPLFAYPHIISFLVPPKTPRF